MEYYLNNGTQQTGPFTLEELKTDVENKSDYYIWCEGLEDWQPLSEFLDKDDRNNLRRSDSKEMINTRTLGNPGSSVTTIIRDKYFEKELTNPKKRSITWNIILIATTITFVLSSIAFFALYKREINKYVTLRINYNDYIVRDMQFENATPILFIQRLIDKTSSGGTSNDVDVKFYNHDMLVKRFLSAFNISEAPEISDPVYFEGITKTYKVKLNPIWGDTGPQLLKGSYRVEIWDKNTCMVARDLTIQ